MYFAYTSTYVTIHVFLIYARLRHKQQLSHWIRIQERTVSFSAFGAWHFGRHLIRNNKYNSYSKMYSQGFRTYQDYRRNPRKTKKQPAKMGNCGVALAKYSVFFFNLLFMVSSRQIWKYEYFVIYFLMWCEIAIFNGWQCIWKHF